MLQDVLGRTAWIGGLNGQGQEVFLVCLRNVADLLGGRWIGLGALSGVTEVWLKCCIVAEVWFKCS